MVIVIADLLQQKDTREYQPRKKVHGQCLEGTRFKLPRVLSQWNHKRWLISPAMSCDNMWKMLPTKEGNQACKVISVQGFCWGWLCKHPLSGTYQNFRFSEAKQVFSINHIVYTDGLGTVSHSYQGITKNPPILQVPRCWLLWTELYPSKIHTLKF